jgi:ATP-dependent protease ClpP protease subunit
MIADLAIGATGRYLRQHAVESPSAHREFWESELARYEAVQGLSNMQQQINWLQYPNLKVESTWKSEPLSHLPTVAVGFSGYDDVGIWRFAIRGVMCFREGPAELADRAKKATAIELEIDSAGGNGRWSLEFGARLRALGVPITATAYHAFSAGALLFQAADVRKIRADGSLMIHGPHGALFGCAEELETEAARLRAERGRYQALYCRRSGQPSEVVDLWLGSDHYFTPEEAVAAGLADEIVPAEVQID